MRAEEYLPIFQFMSRIIRMMPRIDSMPGAAAEPVIRVVNLAQMWAEFLNGWSVDR